MAGNGRKVSQRPGWGRLWVVAAALMWSSCGVFVKAGAFDDWPPSASGALLAFWRSLFAALVLLPLVRRPRWNVQLLPLTVCFTVMCITYLSAVALTTAANAIWLQSTAPWWVFLLSVLLLREPVARRELIPLGLGMLGVGTILGFELHGEDQLGVACGLAAGVGYGGVLILLRRLRSESSTWLVALCHSVAAVAILPWVIYQAILPSPGQLAVLAAFGVFQMALPYLCMTRGLRTISSQEAAAIALVEPVLMPLWVLLLGIETPRWWTVMGASLILVGLVLRYGVIELLAAGNR